MCCGYLLKKENSYQIKRNKKDFVDEILLEIDLERIIQNLGG